MTAADIEEYESQGLLHAPPVDETSPLLSSGASTSSSTSSHSGRQRSLWQRIRSPNPFWMAALTFFGSISRSMVLAPRVEAYTQIACHNLPLHHTDSPYTHLNATPINTQLDLRGIYALAAQEPFVWVPLPVVTAANGTRDNDNGDDDEPITTIPSKDCLRNPKVQAEASRIQYLMTLIMGVLSSFSTGLWGQFGDRYGRRPVLIVSSFGLMFVDIVFVLVAIPHSAFSGHGHRVLLVAPFVEGLLGGWSTFIATTNAYISDCTENGSRAKIFSRISGLTYVGFALGPILGNLWVRLHPAHTTDRVFLLSIAMAAINLTLLALLVPESVSEEDRQKRQERSREAAPPNTGLLKQTGQSVFAFLAPLKLFVPKTRGGEVSWSDYKDWNLTCLAIAMFCYLLTVALFQIKYLYATTVYLWDGTQLNNYISVMGLVRGLHLLFILPALIRIFRNRSSRNVTLKQRSVLEAHSQDASDAEAAASSREIHFDLLVVKFSLGLDLTSHLLVTLLHPSSGIAFTAMTALSSMGAGLLPAAQSLALCIMHASGESAEVGKLFGALSVLQAVGSTILGPTVFAMLYQRTVGKWNEAIFALAAGMILVALAMVSMIRSRKYVIEGTLASVRAHRKHWLQEEDFAEGSNTVSSPAAAGPSTSSTAVGSLLGVPVPGSGKRRGKERGRSRRSKDISIGSSSVSDSDPSRSLPQAFHKYKLPLQQQDSAAA